jgi:peptidyl-tRNA hydrolase, PTH1 family
LSDHSEKKFTFCVMKLIVGLGNPGEKYIHTRHNLGFDVVDKFLRLREPLKQTKWDSKPKLKADIARVQYSSKHEGEINVILAKPTTYMNMSGMAVANLSMFYKIDPSNILIVHDELDLPVGSMKIRFGGAAAGNHGVESILEHLGTDKFWRMRLGIGVSKHHDEMAKHTVKNAEDFVLGKFTHDEAGKVRELVKKAVKALSVCLDEGTERAMNQFNTK